MLVCRNFAASPLISSSRLADSIQFRGHSFLVLNANQSGELSTIERPDLFVVVSFVCGKRGTGSKLPNLSWFGPLKMPEGTSFPNTGIDHRHENRGATWYKQVEEYRKGIVASAFMVNNDTNDADRKRWEVSQLHRALHIRQ